MLDKKVACMSHLYSMIKVVEGVSPTVVFLLDYNQELVKGFSLDLIVLCKVTKLK
jgi:hypothetical protein